MKRAFVYCQKCGVWWCSLHGEKGNRSPLFGKGRSFGKVAIGPLSWYGQSSESRSSMPDEERDNNVMWNRDAYRKDRDWCEKDVMQHA